ncbi:MAG: hypothetical protein GYB33_18435 [Gammaproteobacteria bacterium]|nr:hypothetical protein [Gammaproteobacteria bacterium]
MNTLQTLIAATLFGLTGSAALACTPPQPPALPDPMTAVTPQMVKAKNDVKAFLSQGEAFLDCNKSTRRHNIMVDEMHSVAENFNQIVRTYKQRMAG